ncbi:MAG TPA: L-threonylcarbamoyladenylate synthase [Acidobacteriaceae bacterium]|nr:L-threonylcarbamoyladenylate synthase [Acidobacteriaceae bacterium]
MQPSITASQGTMEFTMPLTTERLRDDDPGIARAAELLRTGHTVAFPTETVYGLGANALDPAAIQKIFTAKQRPSWDPLIVHVDSRPMLTPLVTLSRELQRITNSLIEAFWPGPLTLLLPRTSAIPDSITASRPLVGVRMPAHSAARELIRLAGVPIAAPSANRFGGPSPTTAAHALADLDGRIDAVLDGGPTQVGVESTVLDVSALAIYRPGAITPEMISQIIHQSVHIAAGTRQTNPAEPPAGLASPGMGIRHYAPRARLILVADQSELLHQIAQYAPSEAGVMLPDNWNPGPAQHIFPWGTWPDQTINTSPDSTQNSTHDPTHDASTLARRLYSGLRTLDHLAVKVILCPLPPTQGLGEALRDRLEKAARLK